MVQYTYSSHRTRKIDKIRKQRVKYPQVAKNIVDTSDIVLEVLDARFVEETRNKELEALIEEQKKKIIYIINKADLVKQSKLREIKNEFYPYAIVSCTQRKGIKDLRDLIKRVSKTIKEKEKREILKDKVVFNEDAGNKVKVGVIGYPNAGKSSLLNILAGKSAAGVGADAGFTKNIQKIRLSEDILLVDAPGVIPEDQYSLTDKEVIAEHSLAGGKSYTQVKEPDMIVFQLFKKYPEELKEFYQITAEDSEELIQKVGKQKGFLKKGGVVNENAAGREILRAWQMGEIEVGKARKIKELYFDENIAQEIAEEQQSEEHEETSEILDILAIESIKEKEMPLHIADLYAGAHPDRYHDLFKLLSKNKQNKFDWVEESPAMVELAKEYLEAGNLKRRFRTLDFTEQDVIEYLKTQPKDELDLILIKESLDYIKDLEEFLKLISEKLNTDSKLIGTFEEKDLDENEEYKTHLIENPESEFLEDSKITLTYHTKKQIEKLAKKYKLNCFIGNWKEYLDIEESEYSDKEVFILEKN